MKNKINVPVVTITVPLYKMDDEGRVTVPGKEQVDKIVRSINQLGKIKGFAVGTISVQKQDWDLTEE